MTNRFVLANLLKTIIMTAVLFFLSVVLSYAFLIVFACMGERCGLGLLFEAYENTQFRDVILLTIQPVLLLYFIYDLFVSLYYKHLFAKWLYLPIGFSAVYVMCVTYFIWKHVHYSVEDMTIFWMEMRIIGPMIAGALCVPAGLILYALQRISLNITREIADTIRQSTL